MNSYSESRYRKFDIMDVLSEICVFIFPVAHYLCSGMSWGVIWDIGSLFTLGVGVLNMITKKKIRLHGYEVWILSFFMCCFISTAFSSNLDAGMTSLIEQIKMIVYCIFFMITVIQKKKYVEHCFLSISLVSVVLAIMTISNADIDAILSVESKYLSSLRVGISEKENVNITAFNMTVGFILFSLYLNTYTQKSDRTKRVLIRICQFVVVLGMFFTGTRKALLGSAVVIAFEFLDTKKKIRKIICGLGLILIALYLVMEIPLVYRLVGARIESFLIGNVDASDMIRRTLAGEAKEVFWMHPIIGVGINEFRLFSSYGIYAHNNILEILADFGVVGFLVYYSIFVVLLNKIRRTEFDYRQRMVARGAVIAYFTMEFSQVSYQLLTGTLFLSLVCVFFDFHAQCKCRMTLQ